MCKGYSEESCRIVSFSAGEWPGLEALDEDLREEKPRVEQVNSIILKSL